MLGLNVLKFIKNQQSTDYHNNYQLFELSFWRHPFTAEDPLVSKCLMLHYSNK